ncbi:MAG: tail fiber domain-containing protein [Minisyncoccota bacterium]
MKKTLQILLSTLVAIFSVQSACLAWTGPTLTPPFGNLPPPINFGSTEQTKPGGLILNTAGLPVGLIVRYGKVGIGMSAPNEKLDVAGNIQIGQNAKITAINSTGALADLITFDADNFLRLGVSGGNGVIFGSGIAGHINPYVNNTYNIGSDASRFASIYGTNGYFGTGLGAGTIGLDANYKITTAAGGVKAESTSQPAGYFSSATGYGLLVNSGNVGIGIINPASIFTVDTDTRNVAVARIGNIDGSYDRGITVWTADDSRPANVLTWRPTLDLSVGDTPGYSYAGKMRFSLSATGAAGKTSTAMKLSALSNLDSYATESDIAVFQGNGNVGIGTTNPLYKLEIKGTTPAITLNPGNAVAFGANAVLSRIVARGDYGNDLLTSAAEIKFLTGQANWYMGQIAFFTNNSDSTNPASPPTEKMRITDAGNVGIGTATPTQKLDVNGTVKATAFSGDGSGLTGVVSAASANTWTGTQTIAGTMPLLNFQMSVTTGLDAKAKIPFFQPGGYEAASILYDQSGDTTGNGASLNFYNNGTRRTYIDYLGNFHASSDSYATAFYYSSDKTLKNNIQPLSGSLNKILKLQGVSFDWKENNKSSIGLIAQDVEKVYPELVATNEGTGLKSVEYANLVAPLIESIKEQQKQIEELRAEISDLKLKIK